MREAKFLGLYYKGLIPTYDINYEDLKAPNTSEYRLCINIEQPSQLKLYIYEVVCPQPNSMNKTDGHNFDNNDILVSNNDRPSLPLIGNYLINGTNNPIILDRTKRLNYYIFKEYKYRPAVNTIINTIHERNQCVFKYIYKTLLYDGYSGNNLYSLIDSNNLLSKVFLKLYPVMSIVVDMYNNELPNTTKTNSISLKDIIENLNKYNGYILLYTFLFKK